jgi:Skp family chaperone for outer membrane proteins
MKKFIFVVIIFNFFSSISYSTESYYIDIDFILNNSILGKKIIKELNLIKNKDLIELEKSEKELKDLEKEISNMKNVLSKEELEAKINNLKKNIELYREEKNKKLNNFNNLRSKELSIFLEKIRPHIEEFMKKNSIDIVFEKKNIFIAQSKYDITLPIIDLLNKKSYD